MTGTHERPGFRYRERHPRSPCPRRLESRHHWVNWLHGIRAIRPPTLTPTAPTVTARRRLARSPCRGARAASRRGARGRSREPRRGSGDRPHSTARRSSAWASLVPRERCHRRFALGKHARLVRSVRSLLHARAGKPATSKLTPRRPGERDDEPLLHVEPRRPGTGERIDAGLVKPLPFKEHDVEATLPRLVSNLAVRWGDCHRCLAHRRLRLHHQWQRRLGWRRGRWRRGRWRRGRWRRLRPDGVAGHV